MPDITEPRLTRKMWPALSPIALFASRPGENGAPAQLRPVAIQLDYTPGKTIFNVRPALSPQKKILYNQL